MEHSGELKDLAAALAKAQGEIENAHKNANNPHFRSTYADLAEIINTVRPVLAKHGLSVVQLPGFEDGVVTVETMLAHSSGQWIRGRSATPIAKADPQGVGSAVTYLRRYSLAALCGIAQEDDDGNAASPNGAAQRPAATTRTNGNGGAGRSETATANQLKLVKRLMQSSTLTADEIASIQRRLESGMTKKQASDAIDWLTKTIDKRKAEPQPA